ncbi:formylglycine-generating enzyme family protein [Akkermansiaceae bacterium]|nr:formylglycine-generating enzyme family protein [Akkermansiaceae bacterium]
MKQLFFLILGTSFLLGQEVLRLPSIFERVAPSDPENRNLRFSWRSDTGVSYLLQGSDDLETWEDVSGYPLEAESPVEFFDADPASDAKKFYQVFRLDEQAPTIKGRYPRTGAYGISRFSNVLIRLEDESEIDVDSISLTVGEGSSLTLGNSDKLGFNNNRLAFFPGETALGNYGEEVPVVLRVSDSQGNEAIHEWIWTLETESAVLVSKLVVFGSAAARVAGQILTERQEVVADTLVGVVDSGAGGAVTYVLTEVGEDSLVLEYEGASPPDFAVGDYVANQCPTSAAEVFYREVVAVTDDEDAKTLTLQTMEVDIAQLIEGTFSLSPKARILNELEDVGLDPAEEVLPRTSFAIDGIENVFAPEGRALVDDAEQEVGVLSAEYFGVAARSGIDVAMALGAGELLSLDIEILESVVYAGRFQMEAFEDAEAGLQVVVDVPSDDQPDKVVFLGKIGELPVFAEVSLELKVLGAMSTSSAVEAEFLVSQFFAQDFQLSYDRSRGTQITSSAVPILTELVPFDSGPSGDIDARVLTQVVVGFELLGLAGIELETEHQTILGKELTGEDVTTAQFAHEVTLRARTSGPSFAPLADPLQGEGSWDFWSQEWDLLTELDSLRLEAYQSDREILVEGVSLGTLDDADVWVSNVTNPSYRYGGNTLPGENERGLVLDEGDLNEELVGVGEAGEVEVVSESVVLSAELIPEGFMEVPEGSFVMGDSAGGGGQDEDPVGRSFVSAFSMGSTEVTQQEWDEVRTWGAENGYDDLSAGASGGADHPVYSVNWYDVVKWCNAKSEMDGRDPVYLTSGEIYRSGRSTPVTNYGANGYRLPTEAEWEKAARGGLEQKRFPWGDTIDSDQATFQGGSFYNYDLSEEDENDAGEPSTSAVGSFAANDYGLFDVTGNVWEWCNDWYDDNFYSVKGSRRDLVGPPSGNQRVARGGGWDRNAWFCRCAIRRRYTPTNRLNYIGFRLVVRQ